MVSGQIRSFVALGDSFTEGLGDPETRDPGELAPGELGPGGVRWRGWADRFAERLAVASPGLRYANLAVRGKRLHHVLDDQVPVAEAMVPDLISIMAGGNDLLGPRADPDEMGAQFDDTIARLRATGAQVLVFTGFDPRVFPVLRLIRGKAAAYNMHIRSVAARRGCLLADLWSVPAMADPRAWEPDRIHLTAEGHYRVALLASEILGLPVDADWRAPLPADGRAGRGRLGRWLTARSSDAAWTREYFTPWVARRVRGVSTGDDILPKRPVLAPVLGPGSGPSFAPAG
jgi:lysophospholipase L1-like esterase